MSSGDTALRTLPSFSTSVVVPAPVTTTSPSCSGLDSSAKSCVRAPGLIVTRTLLGRYPTRRAVMVTACRLTRAAGIAMEYDPSSREIAPKPSSGIVTAAPVSATPPSPVTWPVRLADSCPTATVGSSDDNPTQAMNRRYESAMCLLQRALCLVDLCAGHARRVMLDRKPARNEA